MRNTFRIVKATKIELGKGKGEGIGKIAQIKYKTVVI